MSPPITSGGEPPSNLHEYSHRDRTDEWVVYQMWPQIVFGYLISATFVLVHVTGVMIFVRPPRETFRDAPNG